MEVVRTNRSTPSILLAPVFPVPHVAEKLGSCKYSTVSIP